MMRQFRWVSVLAAAVAMSGLIRVADAQLVSINFDTDANGNALTAPPAFSLTVALTNLYSSLGVTFSGPGGNNGGAILNQAGNFGVPARSSPNFLAFNRTASMNNGGIPTDPEQLTFSVPVDFVSIYAAGGSTTDTFVLSAFDANNTLLGTDTVTSVGFAQIDFTSTGTAIASVRLTQTGDFAFVYDDLSFNVFPEPGGLAVIGLAGGGLLGRRRARAR